MANLHEAAAAAQVDIYTNDYLSDVFQVSLCLLSTTVCAFD